MFFFEEMFQTRIRKLVMFSKVIEDKAKRNLFYELHEWLAKYPTPYQGQIATFDSPYQEGHSLQISSPDDVGGNHSEEF